MRRIIFLIIQINYSKLYNGTTSCDEEYGWVTSVRQWHDQYFNQTCQYCSRGNHSVYS